MLHAFRLRFTLQLTNSSPGFQANRPRKEPYHPISLVSRLPTVWSWLFQQHLALSRLYPWKQLPLWEWWKEHTLQGWERRWGDYLLESRLWSTYSHILSKTSSNNLHELTISFSLQYSMSIPFLPPTKDTYGWNTCTHTHTQTHTHITNINTHIAWSSQTYILLKMLANLQLGNS